MKEEIQSEILKLYSEKGVTIGNIEKRLQTNVKATANDDKYEKDIYFYYVMFTFPGHDTFTISIKTVSDVKNRIEAALQGWGIKL